MIDQPSATEPSRVRLPPFTPADALFERDALGFRFKEFSRR